MNREQISRLKDAIVSGMDAVVRLIVRVTYCPGLIAAKIISSLPSYSLAASAGLPDALTMTMFGKKMQFLTFPNRASLNTYIFPSRVLS